MTNYIQYFLFITLTAVAVAHAAWATGHYWPARDARQLSVYVIGDPTRPGMPPAGAISLVAIALFCAALDALALTFQFGDPADRIVAWIGAGFAAVFGCRGVAGYLSPWRSLHPGPEFALLDRRFYSPFCILVAEGFFLTVAEKL